MKLFMEAIRREKVTVAVTAAIVGLVVLVLGNIQYQQFRSAQEMKKIESISKEAEPRLIEWAAGVVNQHGINWSSMGGDVRKEFVPTWIETLIPGSVFSGTWVSGSDEAATISLIYGRGIHVVVIAPGKHQDARVEVFRGGRL